MESVRRGEYWGFILDGKYAGNCLDHHSPMYIYPVFPENFAASYVNDLDDMLSYTVVTEERLYHQKLQIGNRTYGVWTGSQIVPPDFDITPAVLMLIDMDPEQAKMCEIRRL